MLRMAARCSLATLSWAAARTAATACLTPVPERGGICTIAADPAKLEDPSLIIYNPVLTLGKTHIVTNGDQTDTIYDLMSQGKSFADALRTRTFEPDGPTTPPASPLWCTPTAAIR